MILDPRGNITSPDALIPKVITDPDGNMMCLKMNSEGNYDAYFIAKNEDKDFHVKYSYPDNPDYDVAVFLERINFD